MTTQAEVLLEKIDVYQELDSVNKDIAKAEDKLKEIVKVLNERKRDLTNLITKYAEETNWSRFQPSYLTNFVEEPYVIEPSRIGKNGKVLEWHVYVPKMVEFHVGRLERATHSYNVFSVTEPSVGLGLGFMFVLVGGLIAMLSSVVNSFSGLTMLSFAMRE